MADGAILVEHVAANSELAVAELSHREIAECETIGQRPARVSAQDYAAADTRHLADNAVLARDRALGRDERAHSPVADDQGAVHLERSIVDGNVSLGPRLSADADVHLV